MNICMNVLQKFTFFSLIALSSPTITNAQNVIDFSGYPASIKVIVDETVGIITQGDNISYSAELTFQGINDRYTDLAFYNYAVKDPIPMCETETPTMEWFLKQAQTYTTFTFNKITTSVGSGNAYGKKWKYLTAAQAAVKDGPQCGGTLFYSCKRGQTIYSKRFVVCPFGDGAIDPPIEDPDSVCSLNSQNLDLTFSSTSLNVAGLTQSTNLIISCSTGTPKNYQIQLTGTNVSNGKLNFGNGASAQVSLNGSVLEANGASRQLNNLTSQSVPVSVMLSGVASSAGTTNASGILILNAL